jgi:hypothetical protein
MSATVEQCHLEVEYMNCSSVGLTSLDENDIIPALTDLYQLRGWDIPVLQRTHHSVKLVIHK